MLVDGLLAAEIQTHVSEWHSAYLKVGQSFTVGCWWWENKSFACHLFPGADPGVTSTVIIPCNIPLFSVGSLKSFLHKFLSANRGTSGKNDLPVIQKACYKAALIGCKSLADALAFSFCLWRCFSASGHTPELALFRVRQGLVNPYAGDSAVPSAAEVCSGFWLCQGSSGHSQTFKIQVDRLSKNLMDLVRVFSIMHRLDTGNIQFQMWKSSSWAQAAAVPVQSCIWPLQGDGYLLGRCYCWSVLL